MITGSKDLIRDINSHLVLKSILTDGPISRAAIASKLGLTKATISAIVNDQIEKGLIREIGNGDATCGRKPILLEFCKERGNIISIDLGVDMITMLISDLCGNNCTLRQYHNIYKKENIISGLIECIDETMKYIDETYFGVVGISVGIHGVTHENQIVFAPYYDYVDLDFYSELSKRYEGMIINIENEANLSVIGEKSFYYDVPNLIGISVHSGIGTGIILNDVLYNGANGYAGEFGHTIVNYGGRKCPCGNSGCLEQYASEKAILTEYAKLKEKENVSIDEFIADYVMKDKDAIEMMKQFILYISVGINNLLTTFNPDMIVINSSFTIYVPDIVDQIRDSIKNRFRSYCNLVPSGLQDTSILLGGVSIIQKKFLGL